MDKCYDKGAIILNNKNTRPKLVKRTITDLKNRKQAKAIAKEIATTKIHKAKNEADEYIHDAKRKNWKHNGCKTRR